MGEAKRNKLLGIQPSKQNNPIEFDASMRVRIADVIEQTLADAYPERVPFTLCLQRASITHHLLNHLTDSNQWAMQAGGLMAPVAEGDDYCIGWDFAAGTAAGHGVGEIHIWAINRATQVIVDSTSRHFPEMARKMGRQWRRELLPTAWGAPHFLSEGGYHYVPSRAATGQLATLSATTHAVTQKLAAVAALRLKGASVRIAPVVSI